MLGGRAIVLGASSGIGRALAKVLAQEGYRVGITGRRRALLLELQAENPAQFKVAAFDISRPRDCGHRLKKLARELGGLDLLVINSGAGHVNEGLDFEIEKESIEVNVIGFCAAADWGFQFFQRQGYGQLVAVTSVAGLRGNRFAPSYAASKAFQINYLQGLRQKAGHLHLPIAVSDIRPGYVDTAMAQGPGVFWKAPVEKAALQIYGAIQKKKRVAYITKRWNLVALGLRVIPSWAYEHFS